ncbi:MAG TPA: hemin uptake protein HemP [Casimicrobiaceae bacterium]|nr:hemin uptake protein HemP [Casimicrobiaceae bacterium]
MSEAMAGECDSRPTPADATASTDDGARDSPRVVTSDALLRGDSQLAILHDQTVYFLRKTRFGKLILTK